MATNRDQRYDNDEDDELEDLKPSKRRRRVEGDDEPPRKKRRAMPQIKEFSVWVDFGKFISDLKFDAPEGFGVEDVESFIFDLKDEGWKIYQKTKPKNRDNDRGNYQKGGRNRGNWND